MLLLNSCQNKADLTMERANEPFEKQRDRIVGTKGRDF